MLDEKGNTVYQVGEAQEETDENAATTTAKPGGTFYFVMYSQRGTDWEFSRLSINGISLNVGYDGRVYDTTLNSNMVAHFKFDRYEDVKNYSANYDDHLSKDRGVTNRRDHDYKRLKFECWVSNASSDIYVDFNCKSVSSESLTLTKAQGVKRIVASSYDEDHNGNLWWDSLYNGEPYYRMRDKKHWKECNSKGEVSPDNEYNVNSSGDQLPKELFYEEDGSDNFTKKDSGDSHTRMEIQDHNVHHDMTRGSYYKRHRYLYYEPLPGYNSRTTKVDITGATKNGSDKYGLIAEGVQQGIYNGNETNPANKALNEAITDDYTDYIDYYSQQIRHRNITISMDPYKYKAIYDPNGGTINGQSTPYSDSQEYTIEDGSNHILMPTATPVKKDPKHPNTKYVFAGWKYEPLNSKYYTEVDNKKQLKDASIAQTLMPNEKYVINDTTYDYGLDTTLINMKTLNIPFFTYVKNKDSLGHIYYTPSDPNYPKFFVEKENAKNRYTFVAQWVDQDHLDKGKHIYTINIYKQVSSSEYNSLKDEERVEKDNKKYKLVSSNDYQGTDGQTIIGIPPESGVGDYAGYKFNETFSNVKLKNFMNTVVDKDKEPNTLTYYYDFDNTQNLTIWNEIVGNMGDQNQSFDISITLRDENEQPIADRKVVIGTNATIWGDKETTGSNATGTLEFKNGKAITHLKGNQYVTIKNVDIGACDVSVVKNTSVQKQYITHYELVDGNKSKYDNSNQLSNLEIEKNENPKIIFYNVRDVPNTGVYTPKDHPGQMLFLMISGCGAFFIVYKRNERRIRRMILAATHSIENITKIHH